jgi:spermidine/putrescine transport system substrate-binding protein
MWATSRHCSPRELLSAELQAFYAEGFAPDDATYERLEGIERGPGSEPFGDLWAEVRGE